MIIDWKDPYCHVTPHFTVHDCLWLPSIATIADVPSPEILSNLVKICEAGERVRATIGQPMNVTSMYRPPLYSPRVGGSEHDVHTRGLAMDFYCAKLPVHQLKSILEPELDALEIRMERGTLTWVHIDIAPVGPSGRYFIP